jgi:hypothetical protein
MRAAGDVLARCVGHFGQLQVAKLNYVMMLGQRASRGRMCSHRRVSPAVAVAIPATKFNSITVVQLTHAYPVNQPLLLLRLTEASHSTMQTILSNRDRLGCIDGNFPRARYCIIETRLRGDPSL